MAEPRNPEFDNTQKFIELGYNIAYYRKHAGLTQEQAGRAGGHQPPAHGRDRSAEYLPPHLPGSPFQYRSRAEHRPRPAFDVPGMSGAYQNAKMTLSGIIQP